MSAARHHYQRTGVQAETQVSAKPWPQTVWVRLPPPPLSTNGGVAQLAEAQRLHSNIRLSRQPQHPCRGVQSTVRHPTNTYWFDSNPPRFARTPRGGRLTVRRLVTGSMPATGDCGHSLRRHAGTGSKPVSDPAPAGGENLPGRFFETVAPRVPLSEPERARCGVFMVWARDWARRSRCRSNASRSSRCRFVRTL